MEYPAELAGIGDASVVRLSPWFVHATVSSSLRDVGSVSARSCGHGRVGSSAECAQGRDGWMPASRERQPRQEFGSGCYCVATVTVGDLQSTSKRVQESFFRHFNASIRRHCDRVPSLSWASISQSGGKLCEGADGKGIGARMEEVGDETTQSVGQDKRKQKNVLILMSDTGGGHRASAEAIKATFELEYGDKYKVHVVDLWKEHTPWPFNQVPRLYSFFVKHEILWKFAFYSTAPKIVHQSEMRATSLFISREVANGLAKYQPDVIVSVHPLMQHVPLRVLRLRGLLDKIPFTTIITDLGTCHPTWFHQLVTACFCPTEEVAKRALEAGLRRSQIRVHGLPIRPSFATFSRSKDELLKELEMDKDLPAVLLVGGGEGMGPVEQTARALGESLYDANTGKALGQLVVVCGRNKGLVKKLQKIQWNIPVKINGFVTNMSEWMAACDCIITKAGPGTIAEALIRGLPMVLFDFIAGQEVGNVSFVVDNGAGAFCDKPKVISKIIADWFGASSSKLKEMTEKCKMLGQPDAVFKIVHDLDDMIRNKHMYQDHLKIKYRGLI
ncbi:probable monogalactosyldiacylglycerol synthase, chloroplastic [Physcomitrium patens]|uniref:monogalactosyldiacylglycerol synthase n=1 Tax=Physcomitrium patens TaxID=3218 RepID=A0A2K1IYN7_PHYPA|nr:probable monogalactosyldiacylglycerol synthase, chloroplastic [Physcomitrium patens]PNR34386.1 hypothetical protein PHYPA_024203 [Physcomitrium patens]|eukprot:XP_024404076.1 probable monogalactosyldiacylglycerol synthase, chloroplastic [Physcomitrella patens]